MMNIFTNRLLKEGYGLALLANRSQRKLELRRLAELGRISASLIHEMSTPLSSVTLTLDIMRQEKSSAQLIRARKDLRVLETYISAAKKQIKAESNQSNFSLTVAIHQVVMLLSSRAKMEHIKILVKTIGSIRLNGDLVKFHQIMANLINNAIESYEGCLDNPRLITITVNQLPSNDLLISVIDQGQGIRPNDKLRIFDPFYSRKEQQGMGIGLAIVKQYVEQDFKGKVSVSSRVNENTNFSLILPKEIISYKPTLS